MRMNIIVYFKTGCPFAADVMDFLDEHELPFEERNISVDGEFRHEVEEKSGQSKSPTLDIDGHIIADAGVEEVADYLESIGMEVNS
jgi:glutaredoxin 3